ncbi:MAG: phage GP46 family protein [Pseudomonadaceae bacterium]|nr:phage GP46 family protein [Pseudomonadaceae bacterium]
MTDIALAWNGREADIAIVGGDLVLDHSLQTPVLISLFSDRRARADDALPGSDDDRRGWPGDAWPNVLGDQIGSRLWLLSREKEISETLRRAREYGKESITWTLEDGIAARVDVTASVPKRGTLNLAVAISRRDGRSENHQFDTLWEAL